MSAMSWRLAAISHDERVPRVDAYRDGPGHSIPARLCLAKPEAVGSDLFRIFDGVHRAVQMVRDHDAEIPLCVVHEP
jgi:hypothetical protein